MGELFPIKSSAALTSCSWVARPVPGVHRQGWAHPALTNLQSKRHAGVRLSAPCAPQNELGHIIGKTQHYNPQRWVLTGTGQALARSREQDLEHPGVPRGGAQPPGVLGAGTAGTPQFGSWPGCSGSPLLPLNESCFCFASCLSAEVCKQEEALPVHPASGERGVEKMTARSATAFTLLRTGGGRPGRGGCRRGDAWRILSFISGGENILRRFLPSKLSCFLPP